MTVPPGFAATLGARPGVLMHIEGVDAALALALRLNLPSGARLTASPAAGERPDLVIWRPRSATGPAVERLAALSARLPAGSRLWLVTPAPVPARLRPLWTAAAALRLAFGGTVPFPEGMEGARFVRRGGAVR